jgi:SNF2 family DNA or RNA helicase
MNGLLPNQHSAKMHLSEWRVGALFMEAGTGKTRVAVELANSVSDVDLLVWIAPLRTIVPQDKSITPVSSEIAKWGGFRTAKEVVYIGAETISGSDRQYLQLFAKVQVTPKCFLIMDESIKIKNIDAKRTERILELGKMAAHKLILNGTPITRDLLDLYPQMNFLSPKILNMGLAQFKNTFCKYTTITRHSSGYGRSYTKEFITGYENIDYLYSLIRHYVFECDLQLNIRQLYEEKRYSIDDEAKEEYYRLKAKYLDNEMLQFKNNNIFLEMTMKMQHEYCCTEGKFEAVTEWLKTYDESKTLIFCKYIDSANECRRRFPKATVLNYKTGSLGHNLQHLPYTIYFDKTFDYGDMAQSSHRNYRVGQMEDVRYLSLTGDVGLENIISRNIDKKVSMTEYFKKISKKELEAEL